MTVGHRLFCPQTHICCCLGIQLRICIWPRSFVGGSWLWNCLRSCSLSEPSSTRLMTYCQFYLQEGIFLNQESLYIGDRMELWNSQASPSFRILCQRIKPQSHKNNSDSMGNTLTSPSRTWSSSCQSLIRPVNCFQTSKNPSLKTTIAPFRQNCFSSQLSCTLDWTPTFCPY